MQNIDAHVHVFDRLSDEYPREVIELAPADRTATVEELLTEMDAAGVDRAVLIQMNGFGLDHHRYVADAIRRWPARFSAAGLVDMTDPDPPARLSELHDATGIRGIRLMGSLGEPATTEAENLLAYPLVRRAEQLALNVNLYCPADQIGNVERLVRAVPGVPFSLDHLGICPSTSMVVDEWGRPRFNDEPIPPSNYGRVLDLACYSNVYVKVSGEYAFSKRPYPYGDMRPMVERLYAAFGAGRLMWCTDFPWIQAEPSYGRLVELIDHHLPGLSTAERARVMGGNAMRLWFGE
jgi:L-fuconolactonase